MIPIHPDWCLVDNGCIVLNSLAKALILFLKTLLCWCCLQMGVLLPDYQVASHQAQVIVVRHSFPFSFHYFTQDDLPQLNNIWL